ncbi:MAG TPA: hypothetical protein LFW14_05245 [Rickettsia endosymbiont of Degeeriella rufa]|nr:hypothetical protein [Rickettsia endosymbiont of Degeeriella rufa]
MISVNLRYIEACDTILTGIFDKQPREIKDNFQKQLCKFLGKYLLKLGLFRKAEYKFQEAQGLTNDSKEQIELEVKINEIRGMGSNLSFLNAKREFEDLSIFKDKPLGKLFLVGTKKLLNNITNKQRNIKICMMKWIHHNHKQCFSQSHHRSSHKHQSHQHQIRQ